MAVIEYLEPLYDLVLYFTDSNIWSESEFEKRKKELINLAKDKKIELITASYDHEEWLKAVVTSENKLDQEGGTRCERCFTWRLEKAAQLASERNIEFIATTLSVSPRKDYNLVNQILSDVAAKYGLKPLLMNFRKLFNRSVELSREYGFYRQKYCGCEFSARKEK